MDGGDGREEGEQEGREGHGIGGGARRGYWEEQRARGDWAAAARVWTAGFAIYTTAVRKLNGQDQLGGAIERPERSEVKYEIVKGLGVNC